MKLTEDFITISGLRVVERGRKGGGLRAAYVRNARIRIQLSILPNSNALAPTKGGNNMSHFSAIGKCLSSGRRKPSPSWDLGQPLFRTRVSRRCNMMITRRGLDLSLACWCSDSSPKTMAGDCLQLIDANHLSKVPDR